MIQDIRQYRDGKPIPSDELVELAREIAGNRLILSFSGRDSLALWLYLLDHGFELIPYWCYTVPGLSYETQMIEYYEEQFDTEIIRVPHPRTYEYLRTGAWQHPDTWGILKACNLPSYEFADVENWIADQFGLGPDYLCAVGMRAADGLTRLRMIRQMGPIGLKRRRYYYAIWDWKTADVKRRIHQAELLLPRCYLWWGSTGSGVEYIWLKYLRDHLPDDYGKILDLFPLADLELYRYEELASA